jgi:hypothetical protein
MALDHTTGTGARTTLAGIGGTTALPEDGHSPKLLPILREAPGYMDPHLILAHKLARLGSRPMTAFLSTHLNRAELRAMFRPWKAWCRVEKSEEDGHETISCAVYEVPPLRRLIGTFAQQPAHVLHGDFADTDAFDVALVQEVAHHDSPALVAAPQV